ncbi:hypothetical protein ES707_09527 [subsurface metagenome]
MHSGGIGNFTAAVSGPENGIMVKTIDSVSLFCYYPLMATHIVKVQKQGKNFRVNIPRQIVRSRGWEDVLYVLISDLPGNSITIRRFVDGESLKAKDHGG